MLRHSYVLLLTFWIHSGLVCEFDSISASAAEPDILVVRDGWQEDRDTVRKVLESTARELSKYFPDRNLAPIIVYPKGGPIVYFKRGVGNEYIVHLDTGKTYWAQYAFQFSHVNRKSLNVTSPTGTNTRRSNTGISFGRSLPSSESRFNDPCRYMG